VSCNLILLCTGSINSDHSKTWKLPWLNKHKINKDLKQGKYSGQNKHKINKDLKQGKYPGQNKHKTNKEEKMTCQKGCFQNVRQTTYKIIEAKRNFGPI